MLSHLLFHAIPQLVLCVSFGVFLLISMLFVAATVFMLLAWIAGVLCIVTTTLYYVISITVTESVKNDSPKLLKLCKAICRLDQIDTLKAVTEMFELATKVDRGCAIEFRKRVNKMEFEKSIKELSKEIKEIREKEEVEKKKEEEEKKISSGVIQTDPAEDSQDKVETPTKKREIFEDWVNEFKKKYEEGDYYYLEGMIKKIKSDETGSEEQRNTTLKKLLEDLEKNSKKGKDEN